jgi:hypothetical protein
MNKKKWHCPNCTYDSGRRHNIERHIERKHYSGTPVLNPEHASKRESQYFLTGRTESSFSTTNFSDNKITKSSTFADNYQFADKKLKVLKDIDDALNLEEGQIKNLIMKDLFQKFENLNRPFLTLSPQQYIRPVTMSTHITYYPTFQPTEGFLSAHMLNVLERILQSRPQAYANTSADFELSPKFDRPTNLTSNKPNRGRRRRRKTVNLQATSRETEVRGLLF